MFLHNGKILIRNEAIAMDENCCCCDDETIGCEILYQGQVNGVDEYILSVGSTVNLSRVVINGVDRNIGETDYYQETIYIPCVGAGIDEILLEGYNTCGQYCTKSTQISCFKKYDKYIIEISDIEALYEAECLDPFSSVFRYYNKMAGADGINGSYIKFPTPNSCDYSTDPIDTGINVDCVHEYDYWQIGPSQWRTRREAIGRVWIYPANITSNCHTEIRAIFPAIRTIITNLSTGVVISDSTNYTPTQGFIGRYNACGENGQRPIFEMCTIGNLKDLTLAYPLSTMPMYNCPCSEAPCANVLLAKGRQYFD